MSATDYDFERWLEGREDTDNLHCAWSFGYEFGFRRAKEWLSNTIDEEFEAVARLTESPELQLVMLLVAQRVGDRLDRD